MQFKHLLLLPALSALAGLAAFFPAGMAAMGPITFLLITLATVLLSTFLLRYESHQPPLLPQPPPLLQPLSSTGQARATAGINGGGFIGLSSCAADDPGCANHLENNSLTHPPLIGCYASGKDLPEEHGKSATASGISACLTSTSKLRL